MQTNYFMVEFFAGADQFLSGRRGSDFLRGCIGALPKR